MFAENIDVSIRIGHLPDSMLIARKLGDLLGVLCACPSYLKNAPSLKKPRYLLNHRCLFYRSLKMAMNSWSFSSDEGEQSVTVSGALSINDPGALISAALEHKRIAH